ncbi:MAG: TatD family hydrolase [Candidatus Omnitrophica bacterium]|nr:TatD family hydrolase [Candidatus Omnitrophota bacterium]
MPIIDTHAHIDQLTDCGGALKRADAAGVSDIVAVSVDLASMQKTADLAKTRSRPRIHPAFGVHPLRAVGPIGPEAGMIKAQESLEAQAFMRAHLSHAVAVGETGLDYWYQQARKDEAERNRQKASFLVHLDMANEFDLPLIIHSRGAWGDCLAMTRAARVRRALFHWYSGPLDILDGILEAGYYVSTGPSVAYSPPSREAMAHAPLERILVETDSPVRYNGPQPFDAEPRDVLRAWAALSRLKNKDEAIVLDMVNANAKMFFKI